MRKAILLVLGLLAVTAFIAVGSLFIPAQAATLTQSQIDAVISLLQAFGVSTTTISSVQSVLSGAAPVTGDTVLITGDTLGFLRLGSTGNGVKILQIVLAADPSIYPEGVISGYFGRLTEAALKRYQKKHRLEQVGFIGPKTLKKLRNNLEENQIATEQDSNNATSTVSVGNNKHVCAIVPPGHLIAPGWLKKQGGVAPIVPSCQVLPPGIAQKLGTQATTTPDVLAPVISSVSASSTASTTATINWTTNEAAISKVYYATTSPLDLVATTTLSVANSTLVTSHSFNLTGLTASTTYYFAVESKDVANNTATSSQQSFVTLGQ